MIKDLFQGIDGISEEGVNEWLVARHYILEERKRLDVAKDLGPKSGRYVHVEIILDGGSDRLAAAIVRQVALITHYPNFKEGDESTRTVISVIHNNEDSLQMKELLKKYLGNLTDYCQFVVDGKNESRYYESFKNFMPLDVAIEIRKAGAGCSLCPDKAEEPIKIRMSEVKNIVYHCNEDADSKRICQAQLINMAYNLGKDIDNLPAYDNANVPRYETALHYFFSHTTSEKALEKWTSANVKANDRLSCLFCADCIKERLDGLLDTPGKTIDKYLREERKKVDKAISDNIDALALCEHSRWNVERLILGYRPYSFQEHLEIEDLFGDEQAAYRKRLKNDGVHMDLCSYKNLRRIDPGNIKYDYFLMLAIPYILAAGSKKSPRKQKLIYL